MSGIRPGIDIGGVDIGLKGGQEGVGLNTFLSKLNKGLLTPSRFRTEFYLPMGIVDIPNPVAYNALSIVGVITGAQIYLNLDEKINIFCHSCSLPMRSVGTWEHKMYGAPYKVPNTQTNDTVMFSFYADSNMNTRKYFDIWQNAVLNVKSNTMNYYDEFVSDVKIFCMDREGKDSYEVQLYDAYPLNIGMVDLSYASRNSVVSITVSMAFKYWKAKTLSLSLGPVGASY